MTENELKLVKGALAALSQNAEFPADTDYARRCLNDAIATAEARPADAGDAELFVAARDKLAAADALAEALGAMYAYEYEEIDLPTWKARFPNIAWTKREIKLAAQTALRQYREAGKEQT